MSFISFSFSTQSVAQAAQGIWGAILGAGAKIGGWLHLSAAPQGIATAASGIWNTILGAGAKIGSGLHLSAVPQGIATAASGMWNTILGVAAKAKPVAGNFLSLEKCSFGHLLNWGQNVVRSIAPAAAHHSFAPLLMTIGGASLPLLAPALITAAVLLVGICFWLHQKHEAKKVSQGIGNSPPPPPPPGGTAAITGREMGGLYTNNQHHHHQRHHHQQQHPHPGYSLPAHGHAGKDSRSFA